MAISRSLLHAAQKIIDQRSETQLIVYEQIFNNYDNLTAKEIKSKAFGGDHTSLINDDNDLVVKFEFITN